MSTTISDLIDQIYDSLGGDDGKFKGISYDKSNNNNLKKLLQTPDFWGNNPQVALQLPFGKNLLKAITELISSAKETVDIATLLPLPDGLFLEAIVEGLLNAAKNNPYLVVRFLGGLEIPKLSPDIDLKEWLKFLYTGRILANNCKPPFIVLGQYIYFRDKDELCRVLINSKELNPIPTLIARDCGETFIIPGDGHIYFQGSDNKPGLYRMSVEYDGVPPTRLDPYCGSNFVVYNNYVYFQGTKHTNSLYKIATNGSEGSAVRLDDNCGNLLIHNDYIYFQGGNNKNSLYKMSINGTNGSAVRLDDNCGHYFCIGEDDYIYFQGGDKKNSLYKISINGTDGSAVRLDDNCGKLMLQGEYIYFQGGDHKTGLYRMKRDGSCGSAEQLDANCYDFDLGNNGYVYFQRADGLYRILEAGPMGSAQKMAPYCGNLLFHEGEIYYQGGEDKNNLSKINSESFSSLSNMSIYLGAMRTNEQSWNHSKLIIVDGQKVICGGHNLWTEAYCKFAPVHDVSIELEGESVLTAQNFLNLLWTDLASRSRQGNSTDRSWSCMTVEGKIYDNAIATINQKQINRTGTTKILSVGRLGVGLGSSAKEGNASRDARIKAAMLAQESIKLSQQKLDNNILLNPYMWDDEYLQALAEAVARNVTLYIVISDLGTDGGYNGIGVKGTADKLYNVIGNVTGFSGEKLIETCKAKVKIAPLRFYPLKKCPDSNPDCWKWYKNGKKVSPANHAKIYIIDDKLFYVGSDNAYPIYNANQSPGLQEFGFIISNESENKLWSPISSYWDSLWAYSSVYEYTWE